jgi:hypothetical protein
MTAEAAASRWDILRERRMAGVSRWAMLLPIGAGKERSALR